MKKITILILLLSFQSIFSQAKYIEINIPTRVENPQKKYLAADLYSIDTTIPKPVVLIQTPYNKALYRLQSTFPKQSGAALPFDSVNYNIVIMDWRGFYANENADSALYNRGLDGYDAVEWLAQQSWCNGKIGTWGGSALGAIQFQTAAQQPPHLVCCCPFIKDFLNKYEDYYCDGVYRKEHCQSLAGLGFTSEALILSHPLKDKYWQYVEKNSGIASNINVPCFLASGWFDHFPSDVVRAFEDLKSKSDPSVRNKHKLIMGPWTHSDLGQLKQGILSFPEAVDYPRLLGENFFDYYLLNIDNGWEGEPRIKYFIMQDNVWAECDDWDELPTIKDTLYFNPNGLLSTNKNHSEQNSSVSYVFNPKVPSPTVGGSRFNPFDKTIETGPQDISLQVESRPDCLIFSTQELTSGLRVIGIIIAEMYVSSDKTDTDFAIRLCDVYPDGKSVIWTQGIQRMRLAETLSAEKLMIPGNIYPVRIELPVLATTFLPGHKLRIVVSSSDYPMFDLNLNNGGEMYTSGDTMMAHNTIHFSDNYPSRLILPITTTVGVSEYISSKDELKILPNPAMNEAVLSIRLLSEEKLAICVYNSMGQKVKTVYSGILSNDEHHLPVDTSDLPNGVYYIHCLGSHTNTAEKFYVIK